MSRKEDPRVVRTKSMIVDSLVHLTKSTPYKKIKIQDITAHASLARQTFYLHYNSKDEVLIEYINAVFEEFYEEIKEYIVELDLPEPRVAWHLFSQWKNHAEFARLVFEVEIEHLVLKSFKSYITRVVGLYIRNHDVEVKDPEALALCVDYLAGASWMMLNRWIQNDFQYPLEKMAALYTELSFPGMMKVISQGGRTVTG